MSLADKPDWKDAPAWASFRAMDADGSWWWFEGRPRADAPEGIWLRNCPLPSRFLCASGPTPEDWRSTLEDRTPAEQPEPNVNGA